MTLGDREIPALRVGEDCRLAREMLDRIGDKWSLHVIAMLREAPVRFNELRRRIEGISQRMLTLTLRGLERDGLVTRTFHPTIPPQVEYELTELGRTMLRPVMMLADWAGANQAVILQARAGYDERRLELGKAGGGGGAHC